MTENKYIQLIWGELEHNRGVRIGESSILSKNLYVFDSVRPGILIMLKDLDLGQCLYGVETQATLHLDVFHSRGTVSHQNILATIQTLFTPDDTVLVVTSTGSGYVNTNHFPTECLPAEDLAERVHLALEVDPKNFSPFPLVSLIEQGVLAASLQLKKIERFHSRHSQGYIPRKAAASKAQQSGFRVNRIFQGRPQDYRTILSFCKKLMDIIPADHLKIPPQFLCKLTKNANPEDRPSFLPDSAQWRLLPFCPGDSLDELAIPETAISLRKKDFWANDNTLDEYDIIQRKKLINTQKKTILILDNSQSMEGAGLRVLKKVLLQTCEKIRGSVALITFRNNSAFLLSPFTTNKAALRKLIEEIAINGLTPLAHALDLAYEYALRSSVKGLNIVLITDGSPNIPLKSQSPLHDCLDIARKIQKKGFQLTCIGMARETFTLRQIAEAAGGKVDFALDYDETKLHNSLLTNLPLSGS